MTNYNTNRVEGIVFDQDGKERYKIEGFYTGEICAKCLQTN